MADAPEAAAKGGLDFLKHKIGPLPVGVWLVAGIGIYVYFQRQQKPASTTGAIDPVTGLPAGSAADQAALANQNGGGTGDGSAGQSGTPGVPTYTDNNAWGRAAINYLAGLGVDAATANQAIQQYLASQPLTTAQQGDVNLAIQALGPPPSLPGPIASNPPPVTTPPGTKPPVPTGPGPVVTKPPPGKPKSVGAPTGLTVSGKSSHSLAVKWNRVTGATGYHVLCTDMATKKIASEHEVPAATLTATFQGLTPSHAYVVDVWGLPRANGSTAHAEVSATLPRTG
jgi:hypothetical protein